MFLGFTLEGFGLPIPMELLFTWVGRMVYLGKLSYLAAVLVAFGGTLAGNSIGYLIGQYGGRPLVRYLADMLDIPDETLARFEGWFHRYGLSTLFVVRWTGWGYAQLTWFCGVARVSRWRFLAVAAVADLMWAMVWTFAGHRLTRWLHFVFKPAVLLPAGLVALILVVYVVYRRLTRVHRPR